MQPNDKKLILATKDQFPRHLQGDNCSGLSCALHFQAGDYEHADRGPVPIGEYFRQSLVVARHAKEAPERAEVAFDHLAAGQQEVFLFGLIVFDQGEFDAWVGGIHARQHAGVSPSLKTRTMIRKL